MILMQKSSVSHYMVEPKPNNQLCVMCMGMNRTFTSKYRVVGLIPMRNLHF